MENFTFAKKKEWSMNLHVLMVLCVIYLLQLFVLLPKLSKLPESMVEVLIEYEQL